MTSGYKQGQKCGVNLVDPLLDDAHTSSSSANCSLIDSQLSSCARNCGFDTLGWESQVADVTSKLPCTL